jgi:hypothetical protein
MNYDYEEFKKVRDFEAKVLTKAKEKFGEKACYGAIQLNEIRDELRKLEIKPIVEKVVEKIEAKPIKHEKELIQKKVEVKRSKKK